MRWWIKASLLLPPLLSSCGTTPPGGRSIEIPQQSVLCERYVAAWVGYFKANVARLDGAGAQVRVTELEQARHALGLAGIPERSCERPFCMIQPKAGGRLSSYCGYHVASDVPGDLYHWVPWTPRTR